MMELMVAIFIFTVITLTATATFTNIFSSWKTTRQIQANLENARTAMETIGKNIRMSNKLKLSSGVLSMFNNSQGKCIEYHSTGGNLESNVCTPSDAAITAATYNCGSDPCDSGRSYTGWTTLIDSNATVSFNVVPTDVAGKKVGKATVNIVVGTGATKQYLQTTTSFRDYKDFFYPTP